MRKQPFRSLGLISLLLLSGGPAFAAQKPSFISFGNKADAPAGFQEMCARDARLCEVTGDQGDSSRSALFQFAALDISPAPACDLAVLRWDQGLQQAVMAACTYGPSPRYLRGASLGAEEQTARPRRIDKADKKTRRLLARTVREVNLKVNRTVRQRSDLQVYGTEEYWQPAGMDRAAVGDCEDIALQKKQMLIESGFPADRLFLAVVFRSGIGLHTVLVARLDDGDVVLDSATAPVWKWSKTHYSWLRVQSPRNPNQWYRVSSG